MKKDNSIVESKVSMYFEVFVKKIEQITAEKMENKKKNKKRLCNWSASRAMKKKHILTKVEAKSIY